MIVAEEPYDLCVVFADSDAQKLVERFIERGQDRSCIRPIRWRSLRDPHRDTLWSRPDAILAPLLRQGCRYLLILDHRGSGREEEPAGEVCASTARLLHGRGVPPQDIEALAFEPEVEVAFLAAWERVKLEVARQCGVQPPADDQILRRMARQFPKLASHAGSLAAASQFPKEMFTALRLCVAHFNSSPRLFEHLGDQLSLPALKSEGSVLKALEQLLLGWFPPQTTEAPRS